MRESLTQRTLKGAAWIGGASIAGLALRVISVAILARLLTPHEYGVFAAALIAMDFAAMIYGMGLAPTLIQRKDVRPDHVATAFSSALAMAVVAAVGMWYAAPLIAELLRIPELTQILKVLAWLTPLGAFSVLCEALLARNMQVKKVALRPLLSFTISTFLVAIPLAWYGFGYWSLVAMQAVDIIVSAVDAGLCCTDAPRLAELLAPCFFRALAAEPWVHRESTFCLSLTERRQVHHRPRSRYGNTRHLHAGLVLLESRRRLSSEISPASPSSPRWRKVQDDEERLRSALLKSFSVLALLMLPASAFCVIFAPEIVDLLLGAQMAHGRRAIRDPVRDVVFLSRLAQLRHALPGARTSHTG